MYSYSREQRSLDVLGDCPYESSIYAVASKDVSTQRIYHKCDTNLDRHFDHLREEKLL